MKCPYCGNPDTRVIDSRPAEIIVLSEEDVLAMNVVSVLQLMKR